MGTFSANTEGLWRFEAVPPLGHLVKHSAPWFFVGYLAPGHSPDNDIYIAMPRQFLRVAGLKRTQTLHGTAIYAAPLTPLAPPQLIGQYASPISRVWGSLAGRNLRVSFRPCRHRGFEARRATKERTASERSDAERTHQFYLRFRCSPFFRATRSGEDKATKSKPDQIYTMRWSR